MTIFSERRHLAQVLSHSKLRKFTDPELIQCAVDGLTVTETCYRLEAAKTTIAYHAKRIGLVFPQRRRRLYFTEQDDELIRKCARGEIGLSKVAGATNCSFSSVRLRALTIGAPIPFKKRLRKKDPKIYAMRDYDLGHQISVGKDKLLIMLRRIHVTPRDEVYPGSVKVKE